jgi:nucleotide-binding universal stress UspA family protein
VPRKGRRDFKNSFALSAFSAVISRVEKVNVGKEPTMRVLCAIAPRGGAALVEQVVLRLTADLELILLHVIDTGPRHELDRLGTPLHHRPHGSPAREKALGAAEESAGRAALDEALNVAREAGVPATTRIERGKPEQVIVRVAEEVAAALVVVQAREFPTEHPPRGPASVGHTARFVLDHAGCDVLLLRH